MLQNLPFILRRFTRNKLTTSLHLIGLSLGIAVCLLISLFIRHELSFDAYHEKAGRTYRVNQVYVSHGEKEFNYSTPFPLAEQIRKDIAGLEHVTQVHHPLKSVVELSPVRRFNQDKVMYTDPEFLDVFDVEVVSGDAYDALRKPYSAVLTQTTAKKFYGREDPIGKVFNYNGRFNITVGAVIKDFPKNTHLPASMMLSITKDALYLMSPLSQYGSISGGSTFIVLAEHPAQKTEPTPALLSGLQGIYDRILNNQAWMGKNFRQEMELQPLKDIHFNSKYAGGGEWVKAINTKWLWFFGAVGLAVLFLACINFVNLSTAEALGRSKEVGVRKAIGAGKFQLISQFLSESLLLVLGSASIGMVLANILLPYMNNLTGKTIEFDLFSSGLFIVCLFIGIIFISILAGIYPAWVIAKFRPILALKSGMKGTDTPSDLLRKGLVVFQFSISLVLLISLLLIGKQMNYMRFKNLGFNKENIILVSLPNIVGDSTRLTGSELKQIPGILDYSFSSSSLDGGKHWGVGISRTSLSDPDKQSCTTIMTDERYCQLYELKLKAGRFFTISDTSAVSASIPAGQRYAKAVVNETLVKALGFESAEAALGKNFWLGINGWRPEIVGVVADFNTSSLHEEIKPTMISQYLPFCDKLNIKLETGVDIAAVINKIENAYESIYPNEIFEYHFLDQELDNLYKSESRLFGLFRIFAVLAMLISCLGLWGLITHSTQQRIKEIGIRKVLGASVTDIVNLLTKDFILLVCIAIIIASPLAYLGINKWLEDFAFKIDIGWNAFVVSGAMAIGIAMITVSFQSIKGALTNPVKSLRTE